MKKLDKKDLATRYPVIEKMKSDMNYLMELFREVLREHGEDDIIPLLPWSGEVHEHPGDFPERLARAYSISFQLLNMAEENAAAQMRRRWEGDDGLACKPGMWGHTLELLKESGMDEKEIIRNLSRMRVEPVLTAHPTEAKRSSIMRHHRELYLLIVKRENSMFNRQEQQRLSEEIKAVLQRLWLTAQLQLEKIDVDKELKNIIYYLKNVFPDSVRELDLRLRTAWRESNLDPELIDDPDRMPALSFGSWVGGDRDGHPLVTVAMTHKTLRDLRNTALDLIRDRLEGLTARLSISDIMNIPLPEMKDRISFLAEGLKEKGEEAIKRNPDESYRQFLNLMILLLPEKKDQAHTISNELSAPQFSEYIGQPHLNLEDSEKRIDQFVYGRSSELYADLRLLYDSLIHSGARRLADAEVFPVLRTIRIFGFHLANLDIRQNSDYHDKAISQILSSAGCKDTNYASWDFSRKRALLDQELRSMRPFTLPYAVTGAEANEVIDCYRVVRSNMMQNGPDGIGSFIVSMTRDTTDLLAVYIFAREAGLLVNTDDGPACPVPVVPLFETIEDLKHSAAIITDFLEHPFTKLSLEYMSKRDGIEKPVQQVMIGYSDSNKDGGILTGMWHLNRSQIAIEEAAEKVGVRIRFFHGRGGTISRGAGPTARFLDAMPRGTVGGDLRVTEQGETISQKYANLAGAVYNLELLSAGVTRTTLLHNRNDRMPEVNARAMEFLSDISHKTYRELLLKPGLIDFFRETTPIDVLELYHIGSRPSRRTGSRTLEDLRAIPWVFSWSQCRYYITGWYGAGTALERLEHEYPDGFQRIIRDIKDHPSMEYFITNVETSIATADPVIMARYASLVRDESLRNEFFSMIETEYFRTRVMLDRVLGGSIENRRERMAAILDMRQEALLPLHEEQIALLKRWREVCKEGSSEIADDYLRQIFLTINAVASGLRTTG